MWQWVCILLGILVSQGLPQSTSHTTVRDTVRYLEPVAVLDGSESPSGAFQQAVAVDVDADGNVYIVDRGNNRLLKFSRDEFVREVGGFGNQGDQLDDPRDVDASTTLSVLVADYNNERIVHFDRNLNFVAAYNGQIGDGPVIFQRVRSVAFSTQYDIFLLDDDDRQVVKLDRFGQPALYFGGPEETYGQLLNPFQLTVGNEQVFVSDPGQQVIMVYDYLGNFVRAVQIEGLVPLAVDWGLNGYLYVVNQQSNRIVVFDASLQVIQELVVQGVPDTIIDIAVWTEMQPGVVWLYVLYDHQCVKIAWNTGRPLSPVK